MGSMGSMGTGGHLTGWGTGHGSVRTVKEFNEDGDLSRFEYLLEYEICPECGQICDHHKYYINNRFPPAVNCMDCDCGYVYVTDRLTDGKNTAFIRNPGSTGTVLINGGTEEYILTEKQSQRIIETRLVYTKRSECEYNYTGSDGKQGVCHIERIGNLVIATELKENRGMHVADACGVIATGYATPAGISLSELLFVVRQDARSYNHTKPLEPSIFKAVIKIINKGTHSVVGEPKLEVITESDMEKIIKKAMY